MSLKEWAKKIRMVIRKAEMIMPYDMNNVDAAIEEVLREFEEKLG